MDRSRVEELQRLLIEHRARRTHGNFYRGFYTEAQDSTLFQSCDQRQDWQVDASAEIAQRLSESYEALTTDALELVYVEFRGRVAASDEIAAVTINNLSLIRPLVESDCQTVTTETPTVVAAVTDDSSITEDAASATDVAAAGPADITIEESGDAGYVYGYFGAWTALCAADAQVVCAAQTDDTFSTSGDWQLVVDRSQQRRWRVRVTPLTDSHVIGSRVQVAIDGNPLFTIPVDSEQALIGSPLTLAAGDDALTLLNAMRSGVTMELGWNQQNQSSVNLGFSLNGVSLALQYFDNNR